jgi:hypothetical protein
LMKGHCGFRTKHFGFLHVGKYSNSSGQVSSPT